jgi:hypothetical protein
VVIAARLGGVPLPILSARNAAGRVFTLGERVWVEVPADEWGEDDPPAFEGFVFAVERDKPLVHVRTGARGEDEETSWSVEHVHPLPARPSPPPEAVREVRVSMGEDGIEFVTLPPGVRLVVETDDSDVDEWEDSPHFDPVARVIRWVFSASGSEPDAPVPAAVPPPEPDGPTCRECGEACFIDPDADADHTAIPEDQDPAFYKSAAGSDVQNAHGVIEDGWAVVKVQYDADGESASLCAVVDTEAMADALLRSLAGQPGPFDSDVRY